MGAVARAIPLTLPAQAIPRKTTRSAMTHLSPDEVLAVLRFARRHSTRDGAMVLVA